MAHLENDKIVGANRKLSRHLKGIDFPIHHLGPLTYLIKTSNKVYEEHLHPVISYFGQASPAWKEAFDQYKHGLKRKLAHEKQQMSPEGSDKVDKMLLKINLIFDKSATLGIMCMPKLDGLVPLLCPTFLCDLMDLMFNIEPVLELVSFQNSLKRFQA